MFLTVAGFSRQHNAYEHYYTRKMKTTAQLKVKVMNAMEVFGNAGDVCWFAKKTF